MQKKSARKDNINPKPNDLSIPFFKDKVVRLGIIAISFMLRQQENASRQNNCLQLEN